MKLIFRTAIFLIGTLALNYLYAAEVYKRVPFSVTLAAGDKLIAEYDLSENRGIDCDASSSDVAAKFTYKGREKTATLPLLLQNYRVPTKSGEELADTTGKITLEVSEDASLNKIVINCHYRN